MSSNHRFLRAAHLRAGLLKNAALLAIVIVLAGCSGPVAQPTLAPTIDLKPTLDALKAEAAQTVVAGITQSAPTATAVVPTNTAAPTETQAPSETPLPSFTPAPPTATSAPWTATPQNTATPVNYNCTVNEQAPGFGDTFPKSAPFDGRWKVTNTSSTTWSKNEVDFKYISGTKFQDTVSALDLTSDVAHDGTYTVIIDMTAPKTAGRYSATWAFVQSGKLLCPVYLTINVK